MRYYTNGCDGYFNRHVLFNDETIGGIVSQSNCADIFCSVQSYDNDGVEKSSQLVFDIDMESHYEAYDLARDIAADVTDQYSASTALWFSGSKGFHVVTNLGAKGDVSNVAMKDIAFGFSNKIDPSMYKTRSMFRLANSVNGKSNLRKIQVIQNESMQSILERAKTPQPFQTIGIDFENDEFLEDHAASVESYRARILVAHDIVIEEGGSWREALSPCMQKLLTDGVPDGNRWHFCFYLVRHWRQCGVALEDALAETHYLPIFMEAGYTMGMIIHYYSNEPLAIGCKGGVLGDLMQANCSNTCKYSEGFGDETTRNFIGAL